MPDWLVWLFRWWRWVRSPALIIGDRRSPYMTRWHLIPRNRWLNIYLHKIEQDDERVLHDHPWWNMSILLRGAYLERGADGLIKRRRVGSVVIRHPEQLHYLAIDRSRGPLCWSLFITGPLRREWGFLGKDGVWISNADAMRETWYQAERRASLRLFR